MRSAPADGYDFGNKRQYRRSVWRRLADNCPGPRAHAHALLMPSTEGDEIEVALGKGFREYNLHIVDRNPAIVATLKRRFPRVNTYGVEVSRACERIAKAGVRLSVANLDLTACLAASTLATVAGCADSGAFDERAVIAVTLLRGRERAGLLEHLQEFGYYVRKARGMDAREITTDGARAGAILLALSWGLHDLDAPPPRSARWLSSGTYRSAAGTQTILWSTYKMESAASV